MFSLKKTVVIAAIAVILGGLGGYKLGFLTFREANAPDRMDDQKIEEGVMNLQKSTSGTSMKEGKSMVEISAPSQTGSITGGGMIMVVSPQAPGKNVVVAKVSMTISGWVAIHEETSGKPARILGARRFDKGVYSDVNVELLRATESGKIYYAMLHADDGDRAFDVKKDMPIKDSSGSLVMVKFTVTPAPTLQ